VDTAATAHDWSAIASLDLRHQTARCADRSAIHSAAADQPPYAWLQLNSDALAAAQSGEIDTAEFVRRLQRLPDDPPARRGDTLYCSFCGKSQHEVKRLIAGPAVFICDECVDLCHGIVHEHDRGRS
jgi:hypothetical protein